MLVESAITVLSTTPSVLKAMLLRAPSEAREAAGSEGWSAPDVVAHLVLRQRPAIIGRVTAILENPGGAIPGVPPDDRALLRHTPIEEVFDEFEAGRVEAVVLLRRLTAGQLQLSGLLSEVGEVSVADVIHHVAYHDLIHVAQAAQIMAEQLEPLRGAMRVFR